ncbi:uncharacterized protein TNCV_3332471 [Trichonephila clavipes]|nr:uncharacterized protein TNCV_3332471 [Trichonephila clavipes]
MNQTCFQNVEEWSETNITGNNSFQWYFLTCSQVKLADIENYAEFLSKETPDIKIDDNYLFEVERRLNVYLNSNKLEQLENQHAEKLVKCGCQVIYSQFGLAIHQNDHQARHRFVEWAQNEIAVVPDFHKQILFSDEAHFWLNGYINKDNCRIWSEANPQVYVETPLHPEKLTVWCALWAGGILLQKR